MKVVFTRSESAKQYTLTLKHLFYMIKCHTSAWRTLENNIYNIFQKPRTRCFPSQEKSRLFNRVKWNGIFFINRHAQILAPETAGFLICKQLLLPRRF